MTCYKPIQAYRPNYDLRQRQGETKLKFHVSLDEEKNYQPIEIPCGKCIGCRLEYSRIWAIRCYHESLLYENNCFLTLTLSPDYLQTQPNPNSLDKILLQKFWRRLRKKYGKGIRYYACGEYGEETYRPHYHACVFNHDFMDKEYWKTTEAGERLYISDQLHNLWYDTKLKMPMGYCYIGNVTFKSAAYVARYIMKKITGQRADSYYVDENGVCMQPEFVTMSRRPGLGSQWYKKYKEDLYNYDECVINGVKTAVPKYYDTILQKEDPLELEDIKIERLTSAKKYAQHSTTDRLKVREKVKLSQISTLQRK